MRAAILTLIFCVACQSGPTQELGGDADAEVMRVLAGFQGGAAALSTGRMIYVLPEGELVDARRKLIGALGEAEVVPLSFDGFRDVSVVSRAEARVMAFARPQVFETEIDEGTLHVERVVQPGAPPSHYMVSLIDHRRVLTTHLKVNPRLEGAWRALFAEARGASKVFPRLGVYRRARIAR